MKRSIAAAGGTGPGLPGAGHVAATVLAVLCAACGSTVTSSDSGFRTPRGVAILRVEPPRVELAPGDTLTLSVTVLDAAGNRLDRSARWESRHPAVATVDGTGRVEARSQGTASVIARLDGVSDSATVVVDSSSSGGGRPATSECESPDPAWIWCDDFEKDRLSGYFEVDADGGDMVRVEDTGYSGSWALRARFQRGEVSAGSLHLAFGRVPSPYFSPVDDGTARYREIYWRMYLKHEAGWTGGGGYKLSRATVFASSDWAQAMIAHVWSGGSDHHFLVLDPASGTDEGGTLQTTGYNDFDNLRWLGRRVGSTPLFDGSHVGHWYCVEARVKLNDPGEANGVFELWIDGELDARRTGLDWVGGYEDYGVNAVFFENYWNGGSPAAQERFFDNVVVSTERIGCVTG